MKHFVLTYHIGSTGFNYECTTMAECIIAFMNIKAHDEHVPTQTDEFISFVYRLFVGECKSYNDYKISVRYVDGEV